MARIEFLRNETEARVLDLQDQGFIVRHLNDVGRFGDIAVVLPPDFAQRTNIDVNNDLALGVYLRNNPEDTDVRIFNIGANFEYRVGGKKRRETRGEIGALIEEASRPRAEMLQEVSDFIKARREAELQDFVNSLDKEQLANLDEALHAALKESSNAKLMALDPGWKNIDTRERSMIRDMTRKRMREMESL